MIKTFLNKILNSKNSRTKAIKQNIAGSLLVKGISIATSLILVPLTLGYVSSEIYGIWLTISSILYWLTYMDVGFTLGLKNRLAEAIAQKDFDRGRSLVSTTYFIMTVIFVPLTVLLLLISPHIDWCAFLNVDIAYQAEVTKTIQILFVFVALQMISNVFIAVVAAFQKVALSSLFNVIGQLFALIIIFIMTRCIPPALPNLAIAYSMMPILVVIVASVIFFKGKFRQVSPTIKNINIKYTKDLGGLGVKFFIIQIQMIVLYQATNILISHIDGPNAVTQYNIAYKVLNVIVMVYSIFLSPLWPAFTDAYTQKDFVWMNSIYRKMTYVFYFLCIAVTCTVFASPILYKIWIGDKVDIPFVLTCSIALYTIIHCWDSLQVILINGVGSVKLQTYVVLIGLVLHIPLSLFLGHFVGILGIILSMCIINLIYSTFFTIQIRKILSQKATGIWIK